MGRPSDYTPELASLICARMAQGESVRSICRDEEMPATSSIFLWLSRHKEFSEQYARALEARTNAMSEEILEFSDDGKNDTYEDGDGNTSTNHDVIARSRLRVDTRKWLMARMAPKKYGDKLQQEVSGPDGGPLSTITRIELVAAPFPDKGEAS